MANISESNLIYAVSTKHPNVEFDELKKILQDYDDEVYKYLKLGKWVLTRMGRWKVQWIEDTVRWNPRTKTKFLKPAQYIVTFTPTRGVKNLTNPL